MPFWTYMLRCSNGRYYTGHTDQLERRVAQHQAGTFGGYTSQHLPVAFVWSAQFDSRLEALEAERIVGGWSRAKKEALIRGEWDTVSFFAKPPSERGKRFSTSLETNAVDKCAAPNPAADGGGLCLSPAADGECALQKSAFVSSEVEKHSGPQPTPAE